MSTAAAPEVSVAQRLKKGAQVLGNLWRAKEGCVTGWSIPEAGPLCACKKPSRFCKAKEQWLILALMAERDPVLGEHGFAFTMSSEEWDETGLSLKIEVDGKHHRLGKNGTVKMSDFRKIAADPEARRIFRLLGAFSGSKVHAST